MLVIWYMIKGQREAIVLPVGNAHVPRCDLDYAAGVGKPRYPLPSVEYDNALAMPHKHCTFFVKRMILQGWQRGL